MLVCETGVGPRTIAPDGFVAEVFVSVPEVKSASAVQVFD
jgi:hypothetical protein